jgi:hypothetical protein
MLLSREAVNTNLIVFYLTRPEVEHTIYGIRGEHANHYTTVHIISILICFNLYNRNGGVMVSVLASDAVDRVFDFRTGQIKDY